MCNDHFQVTNAILADEWLSDFPNAKELDSIPGCVTLRPIGNKRIYSGVWEGLLLWGNSAWTHELPIKVPNLEYKFNKYLLKEVEREGWGNERRNGQRDKVIFKEL